MDLSDVQTFLRVAELGSLSATAREQQVPVSQISRSVTRLEALHSVRLLHRSTHGLSLTAAGQALLAHGTTLVGTWGDLKAELAQSQGVLRGTVRVGVSPAWAHYVLVPSLAELARLHPELGVDLHVDDRFVDMAKMGLDMTIRTGPLAQDTWVARKIGEHGRRLYAAPSYITRMGLPQTVAQLAQHHLISNSVAPALNRWPFTVDGQRQVLHAKGRYQASSSGVTMTMALQGLGILRGNSLFCEPLVASGQLVRVLDDFANDEPITVNAVMLQERHRSPLVRACTDFWAQWLANQATQGGQSRPIGHNS